MKRLIIIITLACSILTIASNCLAENNVSLDNDNYLVELYVYDNDTGGPITTQTETIRRVYSIVNNGKNKLAMENFGVSGFAIINMTTGEAVETGGTGNMHFDIVVPPHSRQIVGHDDITSVSVLEEGHYRCISGCTIWYKLPPDPVYLDIAPETIIYVSDKNKDKEMLQAISNINTKITHTQRMLTGYVNEVKQFLAEIKRKLQDIINLIGRLIQARR